MNKELKEKLLDSSIDVYDLDSYIKEISEGIEESFWFKEVAILVSRSGNGCMVDYEAIGEMFSSINQELDIDIDEPDPERPNVIYLRPTGKRKIKVEDIINNAPKKTMKGVEFFTKCDYNMRCEDNFSDLLDYLDKIGYFKENLDASLNESKSGWEEAIKSSYNHFVNDLGREPSASEVLEDVVDNYDLNIDVKVELDDPIKYNKWLVDVEDTLNRAGLKFIEESLNEAKSDDIYSFIEDLYNLRKESIANEGEYGLGNLVFKEFRNRGYLDNLKDLRKIEKGKELSLEDLKEGMRSNAEDFEEFFWGVYDNEYDLPFKNTIDYIDEKYGKKIWIETEEDPNPDGRPLNLSEEEQKDIFKHAMEEARYWDNLDIYNSHARYKSVAEINNQLKRIFGITNKVLHEQLKEDMSHKIISTTRNFTKEHGMILCNKGDQEQEVVDKLKNNNYNIDVQKGKGGKVSIKYTKMKRENLKEDGTSFSENIPLSNEEFDSWREKHSELEFKETPFGVTIFKDGSHWGTYLNSFKELWCDDRSFFEEEKIEEDYKRSLTEQESYIINEYRKHAHIDESFVIKESNLDNYALNRVSAYENYDVNDLRDLLLGKE